MKRLRVMKQSEEYYEVPDDFELNELTFKDLSPTVSIIHNIQVLNVASFEDINSKKIQEVKDKQDDEIQRISI